MTLNQGQIIQTRYRVVGLLGQGGFGAVYKGWDTNLNRPVAIKENLDTSPEAQRQFQHEAEILSNLSHPNLPRVTDHFVIPGLGQYLVMDFIEGEDLQAMLNRTGRALPEAQVLNWIDQICGALAHLHEQEPPVIHRDIKPANIKITPKGKAVLVDFGIAKIYDPLLKTTLGARAVTPGYSPPEQYGHGKTDQRSDVYSLGATLYTLLTGQEPPESVERVANNATLIPPRQIIPSLNPNVETAILRACEVSTTRRFQTVAELRQALAGWPRVPPYTSTQVVTLPVNLAPRAASTANPPWGLIASVGAIGMLIIAVLLLRAPTPAIPTAAPTRVPPTATDIPTATPRPPTATGIPTVTPAPTDTPVPTPAPLGLMADAWDTTISAILNAKCAACHIDSKLGDLSLKTYADALKGGKNGAAIVPGDADKSLIIQIQSKGGHPGQPSDSELAAIVAWIKAGAAEVADGGVALAPMASEGWTGGIDQLLIAKCAACHINAKLGDLSLATYANALKGGKDGPVIVPNDSAKSLLVQIQQKGGHPGQLTPAEVDRVIAWITAGAPESGGTASPLPLPTVTLTSTLSIGSTQVSDKDGMTLLYVPAGNFILGSGNDSSNEKEHGVYLDAFWIDQTEVTNEMYSRCVVAGICQVPSPTKSHTRDRYYGYSAFDNYPVVNVLWEDAAAYCQWAGRALPTEAQWEKAARGEDGRTYPWGSLAPDATRLNYNQNVGDTTEVGKYVSGASPYGALDMSGNVWEWVADWYAEKYYASSPARNPTGPTSGDYHVIRGGSWIVGSSFARVSIRLWSVPNPKYGYLGFRCAR